MTLTTYGYKRPDDGDLAKGANGWFAQLVYNINRLDSHNHDGANSPSLTLGAFVPYTSAILAANWAVSGSGYKQTITVPAGVTEVNDYNMKFIFTAPAGKVGEVAYLNYDRLTSTTYDVYCSDNTAAFTAIYR